MTPSASPAGLLFDLDDTLIPETQPLADAYRAVGEAVWGADVTTSQISDLRLAARNRWNTHAPCPEYRHRVHLGPSDGLSAEFSGDGSELAQLRQFLPEFRISAFDAALPSGSERLRAGLREIWWEARLGRQSAFPGARELLESLRGSYRLALVTNGAADFQRHKLELTGLDALFDAIIVSGDLGTGKPHAEPFLAALDALGLATHEVIMIGNDAARDIAGAEALGIRTIWVQPGDSTVTGAVCDLTEIPGLLGG